MSYSWICFAGFQIAINNSTRPQSETGQAAITPKLCASFELIYFVVFATDPDLSSLYVPIRRRISPT